VCDPTDCKPEEHEGEAESPAQVARGHQGYSKPLAFKPRAKIYRSRLGVE
jgi:hypothetical protein